MTRLQREFLRRICEKGSMGIGLLEAAFDLRTTVSAAARAGYALEKLKLIFWQDSWAQHRRHFWLSDAGKRACRDSAFGGWRRR